MTIGSFELELIRFGQSLQMSTGIPVCIQTATDDSGTEFLWSSEHEAHPAFAHPAELVQSILAKTENAASPVLHTTNFLEQFVLVPVMRDGARQSVIVVGPALLQMPEEEIAMNLLNDYGISRRDRSHWLDYWRGLPIASRMRLLHIGALAHKAVNGETLDITDMLQRHHHYKPSTHTSSLADQVLANRGEGSIFQSGREFELRMLSHIQSGNPQELMKMLADITTMKVGVLSKRSQLRNLKNLAICGIAIATRAALDGGLYEELAYTLSDLHIQHIEELSDAGAVDAALNRAFLDFAERVRLSRRNAVSRPVLVCQEYIFSHLYEEITTADLAELAGLHANYLSHLFKVETGLTLMNYIQRERIEEAKKLLLHSRESISAIGVRLCFYDHAHFSRAFKKHEGITPKRYRDRIQAPATQKKREAKLRS